MTSADTPIRVLVVDDSAIVRDMVAAILAEAPGVTVAGYATNGLAAVAKAATLKPDIITMDIEMPIMGGLEAIEAIMAKNPVPILVLTSLTGVRVAFAAVSRGALDVMEKPDLDMESGAKLIKKIKLLARVDIAAHQKALGRRTEPAETKAQPLHAEGPGKRIVAIAASTGGPKALEHILSRLPGTFPLPIVISQHMADGFSQGAAEWLDTATPLKVSMAHNGDRLRPGLIYLNPSEQSLRVSKQGVLMLGAAQAGQMYHPSCDTMLRSVAESFGAQTIGLILTGMGDDGVLGMAAVKAAGGFTLAQDEASSIVFGMNGLAVKSGCIDKVLPLAEIPAALVQLAESKAG